MNRDPSDGLPRAVLLDLDDTIIAYDALGEQAWIRAWAQTDLGQRGIGASQLVDAVTTVSREFWADPDRHRKGRLNLRFARRAVVRRALRRLGLNDITAAHALAERYLEIRDQAFVLLPGALEVLQRLRDLSRRLALVTNGGAQMQWAKIERFGLRPYFDAILVEGEFGVGKPDARIFRHALQRLRVEPEDAWMVGDNLYADIAGAQAVGITGVWVDAKRGGLPPDIPVRPQRVIRSIAELLAL